MSLERIESYALIGNIGKRMPTKTFPVFNPANGDVLSLVEDCSVEDAQAAVDAASDAFMGWSTRLARERATVLHKWYELLIEHTEELAHLMSAEQGKPLTESRAEVAYGASFLRWFGEEAVRVHGTTVPENAHGRKIVVLKEPVGVVAAITPWNFPIAMLTRKLGPALAAGCTVVCKPSEDTPLCALAIARLALEAGVPEGVLNIVPASRERGVDVVSQWMKDSRVRKVSFTGSTTVGKTLAEKSAATLKRLSLELGGNAPFLIFEDADLEQAVEGVIASKFRNTGQTCVCANRILVQDSVYEKFAAMLVERVGGMVTAPALENEHAQLGPLINQKAVDKVERHVKDALQKGARLLLGGERDLQGENFYKPTVLAEATPEMLLAQEETFGPVAPLFRFKTEEEAIQLANATEAGLAAYFYTQNMQRIWRVASALAVGMVGINEGIISTEVAPFGGVKESGYGREGSTIGIEEYLNMKYLCIGGLEGARS